MSKYLTLFFILLISTNLKGETLKVEQCGEPVCELKEVRIDPCKEAKSNKPCKFRSGTNATIEFDYVLNFDSEKLINQAYSVTALVDLPLIGMERDACKYTECPVKAGTNGTYKNALYLSPAFPRLNYEVKWRVWDAAKPRNECCFTFKIKLVG